MKQTRVPISSLYTDPAYMVRASLNQEVIQEYSELYSIEFDLKPLDVFKQSSGKYLIADGWHRFEAAKKAGLKTLPVRVFKGDRQRIVAAALDGNKAHGLRRTNEDKRICAEIAIETWPDHSNRKLAEVAGVGEATIRRLRPSIEGEKRIGSDGKEYPAKADRCVNDAPEPSKTPTKAQKENVPQLAFDRSERGEVTQPVKPTQSGKPIHMLAIWDEINGLYGKALNRLDELNRVCSNSKVHSLLIAGTKKLMADLSDWRESAKKA